jgi:uncharacterized protein (TIGR00156 family)
MRKFLLASGMIACLSGAAFAQYTGPSGDDADGKKTYAPASLAAIVDNPNDGDLVTVEGMLIRKVGDETYVLSDGTTEINVEIDDDDFPTQQVSETTRVRIEGEVDTHLMRETDIEADRVEVLN